MIDDSNEMFMCYSFKCMGLEDMEMLYVDHLINVNVEIIINIVNQISQKKGIKIKSPCHPNNYEFKASLVITNNLCVKNKFKYDSITLIGTQESEKCFQIIKTVICEQKLFENDKLCNNRNYLKFPLEFKQKFNVLHYLKNFNFFRYLDIYQIYLFMIANLMILNKISQIKHVKLWM